MGCELGKFNIWLGKSQALSSHAKTTPPSVSILAQAEHRSDPTAQLAPAQLDTLSGETMQQSPVSHSEQEEKQVVPETPEMFISCSADTSLHLGIFSA